MPGPNPLWAYVFQQFLSWVLVHARLQPPKAVVTAGKVRLACEAQPNFRETERTVHAAASGAVSVVVVD